MQKLYKVFVTTPESHTDVLISALSQAGAGNVGEYTHCAFITKGYGNYMPSKDANPHIGNKEMMNREAEDKIEVICPTKKLDNVIEAIIKNHPYESPTIDVVEIMFFTR